MNKKRNFMMLGLLIFCLTCLPGCVIESVIQAYWAAVNGIVAVEVQIKANSRANPETIAPIACISIPDGWDILSNTYSGTTDGVEETSGDLVADAASEEYMNGEYVLEGMTWRCYHGEEATYTNNAAGSAYFEFQANSAGVYEIGYSAGRTTEPDKDIEYMPLTVGPAAFPDMKLNGADEDLDNLLAGEPFALGIGMDSGTYDGSNADWWLASYDAATGDLYYFALSQGWVKSSGGLLGMQPLHQGPLVDFPQISLGDVLLPAGDYFVYFIIDLNMNGLLDLDGLFYLDSSRVVVKETCEYTLSSNSTMEDSDGGRRSVSITTQAPCGWSATSDVSWITVNTNEGVGSGRVEYTVAPNTGAQSRGGVLTIAGQTYTIFQEGGPVCTLTCGVNLTYSCGSGSYSDSKHYCYIGNTGFLDRLTVNYSNGHTVICTSSTCGGVLKCHDDTGATCDW